LQTGLITSTEEVATEMTYDIDRLQSVAERFSKIGSTPDMSTTPIDDDLQYVYNYLRSRLSKSVTLGLDIAAPGLPVRHEPTLIRWAVENICKNAADAISGTGSITVRQSADEKNVIVDIIDTGKGMDNKTRKHIFDAGYTTKTRGWGIGLALVKRIITEYHKGKVYVAASKIGEGTTFRIELPRR
jgi:signal transduction histidine kinase